MDSLTSRPDYALEVLELMPDALVLIDTQQRIVHVNRQAEDLFQKSAAEILGQPLKTLLPQELTSQHHQDVQEFLDHSDNVRMLEDRRVLSARRSTGEPFSFLGTIAKLHLPDGLRMAIIMHEVTDYLRSEQSRQRSERALCCLTQALGAVIQASEKTTLLRQICDIVVRIGGYRFAWIGFAENSPDKRVRPVALAGEESGYLQEAFISWSENLPSGHGPAGKALRTGKPQFCRNIAQDTSFSPWRKQALRRGFQSVGAFPLRINKSIHGTLTLYSSRDSFDEEEIKLLSTLAENLSFGLTALQIRNERDANEAILKQNTAQLQERIKELNLLYTISKLRSQDALSISDILSRITAIIPAAWQFPELAEARISIEGYGDFTTPGYASNSLSITHSILLGKKKLGYVEVLYSQPPPFVADTIFLSEESSLLESVANQIAEIIHHVQVVDEKDKLSQGLKQTADTVVITDKQGVIEYVNPSFEATTGFTRQEAIGNKPNILKSGEHPAKFYRSMWETILNGEIFRDTVINRAKNGTLYYEYKTITPLYDPNGQITHFLATGKDITEQVQTESHLQYLATHDPVTDLINHGEFVRHVDNRIANRKKHEILAVVVVGADNFKAVNNIVGRSIGDRILKGIGERLIEATGVTLGSLGGDTFGFAIQGTDPKQTGVEVQKILDQLAQPFLLEETKEEMVLTATAGISCYPSDANTGAGLVQKAETAMSRAKQAGIHRFEFYTPSMQANSLTRLRLNKELLEALDQSQFMLYFQPQLELSTGKIAGAEALVRWQHPVKGVIGPQVFIPVLEEMGRIEELGDFVLKQTCSAIRHANDAGLKLPQMAFNLAAPQLENPELVRQIAETLRVANISPTQLEIEITESLLISKYEQVQDRLSELLDMGISIALDDFGTGYSSLQYLTRYPFSKLKIDKSFVWNMANGNKDYEVVKAIISLGHSLRVDVLAEGIETEEHVQRLQTLGCDLVQGYLYSPPVDESSFMEFLKKTEG